MPDENEPPPTGESGRMSNGRFAPGNRAGRGNPMNARAQRIRATLLAAATDDDIEAICRQLVDGAKGGDLQFVREFFDRTIGRPVSGDVEQRLAKLESLLTERTADEF